MKNKFFNYTVSNIYSKPSLNSEVVSQILYGEKFRILSKKDKWIKIKTYYDKYIGYIKNKKLQESKKWKEGLKNKWTNRSLAGWRFGNRLPSSAHRSPSLRGRPLSALGVVLDHFPQKTNVLVLGTLFSQFYVLPGM